MKKLCILAVISMLAIVAAEGLCSPVLISVELPSKESKKSWHQMNIPTYELIGNTAIAEADESQLPLIEQRGYQVSIIDQQPKLTKYMIVSNIDRMPELAGNSIWKNDKTAIIKTLPKDILKDRKYKHQIRPMNIRPLGDRFWTSATTKYVPIKNILYDPFIQSLVDQVNADSIASTIQRLQDFGGRYSWTSSNYAASEWIYNKFIEWGIQTELDSVYIYHDVLYQGWDRSPIATIQGSESKVIIACGHMDTAPETSPGADDDASGVAGAMEIARILRNYSWETTLKFAGWDGEERGAGEGSNHYATTADSTGENIIGVINMDMLGYMNDGIMDGEVWHYYDCSTWLAELFIEIGKIYAPDISYDLIIESIPCDQIFFEELGYPAITAIEPDPYTNPYIHSEHDSLHYLTPAMFKAFTQTALATIGILGICPGPVKDVAAVDLGDGTKLVMNWTPSDESDVTGYWVYYGTQSELYTDSIFVNGISTCTDTIEDLSQDTTYYLAVRAQDAETHKSPTAIEVTATPRIAPVAPVGTTIEPMIVSLKLIWRRNTELDISGYRIYRKIDQGIWDSLNSALVADTMYVDSVPAADSRYWYRIRAYDSSGYASAFSDSFCGYTYAPAGPTATPIADGIRLNWAYDSTKNIAGYIIYRKINQGTLDSLSQTMIPDTNYTDSVLSGANKYYYWFRAYDAAGNPSRLSDSVYSRPITLDQGILVVDETNNWTLTTYPNDAKQDSFYNYILSDYNVTPYEYGVSLQKPILADFGPYSTVAWFADDYGWLLASGAMEDIKIYLDNGGKLWFTGWKPTGDIRNSTSYAADFASGSFIYDYLKVSYASLSAGTDSFQAATGLLSYPSISVDPIKVPISSWLGTMRYIESLTPVSPGEGIYTMDMKNDGSPYEGQVCAVRDSGKTVLFGFPLYFMDKEQAKLAAQKIMAEFGEPSGVSGNPETGNRISDIRLYQNVPNPFGKQTTISYQLPKAGQVKLNIYNIAGQLVKTLINQDQPAGSYTVKWDARDNQNKQLSAGVYIYHLTNGEITQSRKMIVLK